MPNDSNALACNYLTEPTLSTVANAQYVEFGTKRPCRPSKGRRARRYVTMRERMHPIGVRSKRGVEACESPVLTAALHREPEEYQQRTVKPNEISAR